MRRMTGVFGGSPVPPAGEFEFCSFFVVVEIGRGKKTERRCKP